MVQKIMMDLPDYHDEEHANDKPQEIKEQSAEDFAKTMNDFKY